MTAVPKGRSPALLCTFPDPATRIPLGLAARFDLSGGAAEDAQIMGGGTTAERARNSQVASPILGVRSHRGALRLARRHAARSRRMPAARWTSRD